MKEGDNEAGTPFDWTDARFMTADVYLAWDAKMKVHEIEQRARLNATKKGRK